MTPEPPAHRPTPMSDAVKLEAVARLLRQALRLAEGPEGAPRPAAEEGPAAPTAPARPAETAPAPRPSGGGAAGGPAQVGYLLGLLQAEQAKLEEAKKELTRKDTELGLKLQFAKTKEEELSQRESDLKKLEAQLNIRESQIQKREDQHKERGRLKSDS